MRPPASVDGPIPVARWALHAAWQSATFGVAALILRLLRVAGGPLHPAVITPAALYFRIQVTLSVGL